VIHPLRLLLHAPDGLPPGILQPRVIGQRVQVTADDGQRRTEFVRRVGHEIAPHFRQPDALGNVADEQQLLVRAIRHDAAVQPATFAHR
jgi:hypothetical protein